MHPHSFIQYIKLLGTRVSLDCPFIGSPITALCGFKSNDVHWIATFDLACLVTNFTVPYISRDADQHSNYVRYRSMAIHRHSPPPVPTRVVNSRFTVVGRLLDFF